MNKQFSELKCLRLRLWHSADGSAEKSDGLPFGKENAAMIRMVLFRKGKDHFFVRSLAVQIGKVCLHLLSQRLGRLF